MTLHLIKLCVGAESIDDLNEWIAHRHLLSGQKGPLREHVHITRMMPKRASELLEDGSLYWVIKGFVTCRQQLLDVRAIRDGEGISRCALVLAPAVIPVSPRPYRPFQGWRYLAASDASADAGRAGDLPEAMRRELGELGLL
jgi:hypothetical protein